MWGQGEWMWESSGGKSGKSLSDNFYIYVKKFTLPVYDEERCKSGF